MGPKWNASLTSLRPLAGVRVLSMEQAAALPFATRHLADLGADVIRVQSHQRPAPDSYDIELTRNKRQLAIDLAAPGGPEVFRRVATACDVVCHNFTPQVVRKFGIDYESLRALRPDLIYLELTGFGTDGPWRAQAAVRAGGRGGGGPQPADRRPRRSGPAGRRRSRSPTTTAACTPCWPLTDALARRDRLGTGSHLDISLYETAVSQLGTVLAERGLGAVPERNLNGDAAFAVQGSYPSGEPAATSRCPFRPARSPRPPPRWAPRPPGPRPAWPPPSRPARPRPRWRPCRPPASRPPWSPTPPPSPRTSTCGRAATSACSSGTTTAWTGSTPTPARRSAAARTPPSGHAHPVGADTREILASVAGYPPDEIDRLFAAGAVGTGAPPGGPGPRRTRPPGSSGAS